MAGPSCYIESLVCSAKRLRLTTSPVAPVLRTQQRRHILSSAISAQAPAARASPQQCIHQRRSATQMAAPPTTPEESLNGLRLPKAVQSVFLAPLKRTPTHGIPVCDLQIRSYNVRNLEIWADFCMRAAYYLNLAAKGPIPLPRITERWTVPRSNFVHKKSQENFERVTVRRLIQIQDGHQETVALWLAYIQKHRYYGIGMKANVFEYGGLDVAKDLDAEHARLQQTLGSIPETFLGSTDRKEFSPAEVEELLTTQPFKAQWGAYGVMGGTKQITQGRRRFRRINAVGTQLIEHEQSRSDV